MKKLIVFILLLLSTYALSAQCFVENDSYNAPNSLYVAFQHVDLGLGVRYDRLITNTYGVYASLTHGKFVMANGGYVDHHFKIVLGGLYYLPSLQEDVDVFITAAPTHNIHNGLHHIPDDLPEATLRKWSFEVGISAKILNKVNLGFRIDPIKRESSMDYGFSF